MKVLFSMLQSHGDIIRTFKIVEVIKRQYKEAFLSITVFKGMEDTASISKSFDKIIVQEKLKIGDSIRLLDCKVLEESIKEANEVKFDYYIDLTGEFQSALFGILTNIKNRIGPSKPAGRDGSYLFYNNLIDIQWKEINRMERHLKLSRAVFKDLVMEEETFLNREGKIIIAPGTSDLGVYKRWDSLNYKILIEKIINEFSEEIILLIHERQKNLAYEIKSLVNNKNCIIEEVTNFTDAFKKIKKAKMFIGTDSAYNHIAVVSNIPTITILGPTSIEENGPWNKLKGRTISIGASCSPCNLWIQSCKNNNYCMKKLDYHRVYEEVKSLYRELYS